MTHDTSSLHATEETGSGKAEHRSGEDPCEEEGASGSTRATGG